MGIGAKIKEALHGDHSTTDTHSTTDAHPTTANHTTPGTFPSDELPQRNADGKAYTAPHGTAIDNTKNPSHHTGDTVGLASSGTNRNRLSKGTDDPDQNKGAYWGDLSKNGHSGTARDLPDRTRLGDDTSAAAGRHHGTQGHHHDHHSADQAVGGGAYNTIPAQGSHGASKRDPTEDSHFGQGLTGTSASRDHHLAGQSSGGGVYNSVTGSGSADHHAPRHTQTDTFHDPLSSGSKGTPLSSGHNSGGDYDQRTGIHGSSAQTTHNDHAGHSHGLGATGAAAGAGAAAYGVHAHGQHKSGNTSYNDNQASGGVPQSSMLDPEPTSNRSNLPVGGHSGPSGYNDEEATRGAGTGAYNSSGAPNTGHFSGGPSHVNTNIGAGSRPDSTNSPTQSASSGSARKHLGPGHEGAKVLHSCEHCGRDNDISHYFNKDAAYRLGQ